VARMIVIVAAMADIVARMIVIVTAMIAVMGPM